MSNVFIANIAYDTTEEQLRAMLEEVGPLKSLRIPIDADTQKQRGFAFAVFEDNETAASAIRNLSGREFNGRQIRLDFSTGDSSGERSNRKIAHSANQQLSISTGADVLASMSQQQLLDLLIHMKMLVHSKPQEAHQYLAENSSVAYCLLQALLLAQFITDEDMRLATSVAPAERRQNVPWDISQSLHFPSPNIPFRHEPVQQQSVDEQQKLFNMVAQSTVEQIQQLPGLSAEIKQQLLTLKMGMERS